MKTELEEALYNKYPNILIRDKCYGLDIGDGWYNLIDVLCNNIQQHIDYRKELFKNNTQHNLTIDTLHAEAEYRKILPKVKQVVAAQIKEKFGGLRFYASGGDKTTNAMIKFAESMSFRMCEVCGAPGTPRTDKVWISTLCTIH